MNCFSHQDVVAVGICSNCGAGLCGACASRGGGRFRLFCPSCRPQQIDASLDRAAFKNALDDLSFDHVGTTPSPDSLATRARIHAIEAEALRAAPQIRSGRAVTGESSGLSCSFCGKRQRAVALLVSAPAACICDECIELYVDILADRDFSEQPPDPDPTD